MQAACIGEHPNVTENFRIAIPCEEHHAVVGLIVGLPVAVLGCPTDWNDSARRKFRPVPHDGSSDVMTGG